MVYGWSILNNRFSVPLVLRKSTSTGFDSKKFLHQYQTFAVQKMCHGHQFDVYNAVSDDYVKYPSPPLYRLTRSVFVER